MKKIIGTIKAEVKELGSVTFTADSNGEVFMSLERCDVDIDIVGTGSGPQPDFNDKLEITGYVLLARICQKIFPRIKEFYETGSDLNFIINGEKVILPICSNSEPQREVK
jgi:hypothetical protein